MIAAGAPFVREKNRFRLLNSPLRVRQEYGVGSRTTLDVLDAESEVVDARITLVTAEHDQVVAAYQILSSIGRLTARDLRLPVEYYDADENYLNVRGKWIGTGADTIE